MTVNPDDGMPTDLASALRMTHETPWKATNEFERLLLLPFARLFFRMDGIRWGHGWRLYGLPIIQKHRRSELIIGDGLELRSTARSNPLGPNRPCILTTRNPGAQLIIGDHFGMSGGSIVCAESIKIGDRVTVGCNTIISDTDFHPLDPEQRREAFLAGSTSPIVIEDDVFIGMQAIILKGVRLGAGCVVGAGSVITHDVPPGAVVAGNPAHTIR